MTALEDSIDVDVVPDDLSPVIEISDVWKLHKLGDEVVRALVAAELQVMPGEFVCLMARAAAESRRCSTSSAVWTGRPRARSGSRVETRRC
jgi:hypothetical protein